MLTQKKAIQHINNRGILLVFPINNKKEPRSLWSEFFPRTKLVWAWDEDSDNRVGNMWMLMKRLSDCRQVVYSKWYQGRATFFSIKLFTALLCYAQKKFDSTEGLSHTARLLLETLENDSPLSTKQLKQITELRGKDNEGIYNRGLKELFSKFLVVAYGEVDDGAFPSLAVGATKHLYEDLLNQAREMSQKEAIETIDQYMPPGSLVRKYLEKTQIVDKDVDSKVGIFPPAR